jgi:DeoR/GlpR family transcriptional regulator of sugar metabolism
MKNETPKQGLASRLIAIDSGTTNIILSRFLKKSPIPLQGSSLCSLTVCTNSRRIFEELGPSEVWIKSIIIGGQQMFRSPTIAGAISRLVQRMEAPLTSRCQSGTI